MIIKTLFNIVLDYLKKYEHLDLLLYHSVFKKKIVNDICKFYNEKKKKIIRYKYTYKTPICYFECNPCLPISYLKDNFVDNGDNMVISLKKICLKSIYHNNKLNLLRVRNHFPRLIFGKIYSFIKPNNKEVNQLDIINVSNKLVYTDLNNINFRDIYYLCYNRNLYSMKSYDVNHIMNNYLIIALKGQILDIDKTDKTLTIKSNKLSYIKYLEKFIFNTYIIKEYQSIVKSNSIKVYYNHMASRCDNSLFIDTNIICFKMLYTFYISLHINNIKHSCSIYPILYKIKHY